jgi:hypothetical protein
MGITSMVLRDTPDDNGGRCFFGDIRRDRVVAVVGGVFVLIGLSRGSCLAYIKFTLNREWSTQFYP